jgi:hypothetical protein
MRLLVADTHHDRQLGFESPARDANEMGFRGRCQPHPEESVPHDVDPFRDMV